MSAAEILRALPRLSALVVGDICLDRWCRYSPPAGDISRETGIPRVGVVATECTPGAGGTVANNLAALGVGRVSVLGVAGDDGHGYELRRALTERGIFAGGLLTCSGFATFTYTKLINIETDAEDLPRVDFINTTALPPEAEQRVLASLPAALESHDVILVADQAETEAGGVITSAVREELSRLATLHPNRIFWVDSRMRIEHYRNMIVKPNREEAENACRRAFGMVDYPRLRGMLQTPLLVVTHGAQGVLLVDKSERQTWVPAIPVERPVDICGAGDSFSAGAACALAVTRSPEAAARFGHLVASVTIMKRGTGTASPEEVLRAEESVPR